MRPRLPVLLAAACQAGCAAMPPAPAEVQVPVLMPCVASPPSRPAYEFERLPATAGDGDKILALARDWSRARIYEAKLEAAIAACLSGAADTAPDR